MSQFQTELDTLLRARATLILVPSPEEMRLLSVIGELCEAQQRPLIAWDVAEGFEYLVKASPPLPAARDPLTALEKIEKFESNALFILKDFHDCWDNVQVKRKLRSIAQKSRLNAKSILVTAPSAKLPAELRAEAVVLEFPYPNADELQKILKTMTGGSNVTVNLTPLGREKLVQAAVGLTGLQAQRVFARAIVANGMLDDRDIALVTAEKKQVIRDSEALEFYPARETIADVGGLDVLKNWLKLREKAFSREARDYGLPLPKGIALIGIPGTGKSLTAKMIGALWQLPLLRLDIGALFGSLVGESEERTRRALKLAETVAPCVVWIDEMDKGLIGGGDIDGGTGSRVFGTILTWMQEKNAPCFVVATANNIASLPPELLRKGRFDEVFFLDLPTLEERSEIFRLHIAKRKRLPSDYQIERLAKAAAGYVGAEIEQAIIDAMFVGFNEAREFTSEDIFSALKKQVPLSVSQREIISGLRQWLREGRAQSASFMDSAEAQKKFVTLKMPPPKR